MLKRVIKFFCRCWNVNTPRPIWKTIKVGYLDHQALCEALVRSDHRLFPFSLAVLNSQDFKLCLLKTEREVDLVVVSPLSFNFRNGVTLKYLCQTAIKHGLILCSAEVCFYLRLQYNNQLIGENLIAGMNPIIDEDRDKLTLNIFESNDGGSCIGSKQVCSNRIFRADEKVLFILPRKEK